MDEMVKRSRLLFDKRVEALRINMVAIERTYKGYEIHIFVRHFLDTDDWTFSASVFGHAGDPEMIKRMHYRGRLTTRKEAEMLERRRSD